MRSKANSALFEFESADSLAQFYLWMIPLAGGGIVGMLIWEWLSWKSLTAVVSLCLFLIVGLRSSILVFEDEVRVVRKWFFVPYKTYTSPCIEDVSFGGDWGLEEGAIGVVIRMNGEDVHLGSSENMHYLYQSLYEVTYTGGPMVRR